MPKTLQRAIRGRVDNIDTHGLKHFGLRGKRITPSHQERHIRVVRTVPGIAAVPVNAGGDMHVEADQQDLGGAELRRKIESLKTGISTRSDDGWSDKLEFVVVADFNLVHVPKGSAGRRIVREFDA